jgi:hypothetical protein
MAVAVTSVGYQSATYSSADLSFTAFTPAANSLLLLCVRGVSITSNDAVVSFSSDASWSLSTPTKLFDVPVGPANTHGIEVWGSIVAGGSPASASLVVDRNYLDAINAELFELTGVNVSGGTAASCIGVSNSTTGYDLQTEVISLSAFASASNMTFGFATQSSGGTAPSFTDGGWTSGTSRSFEGYYSRAAWIDSEDNSVGLTFQSYANGCAVAFEIKAAGGSASIVPQAMANYRMRAA